MEHVEEMVRSVGGDIKAHYDWGRRKFAYKIRQWTEGLYRLLYFEAPGQGLDELRQHVMSDERVIRMMVVVANPKAIWRPRAEREEEEELEGEEITAEPVAAEAEASAPEPLAAAEQESSKQEENSAEEAGPAEAGE